MPPLPWPREVLAVLFLPLPVQPHTPRRLRRTKAARRGMRVAEEKPRKASSPAVPGFVEKRVPEAASSNTRWRPPSARFSTSHLHPRTCSMTAKCPARTSRSLTRSRATASGWKTRPPTSASWAPALTTTTPKCPARPVSAPHGKSPDQSRPLLRRPAWTSLMQTVPKAHTLCSRSLAQTASPVPKQGESFHYNGTFVPRGICKNSAAFLLCKPCKLLPRSLTTSPDC